MMYQLAQLKDFSFQVFRSMGCNAKDARIVSEILILADQRGIDSHGIARLIGYVRLWEKKRINTSAIVKVIHETPSTAVVNADSGFGMVSGTKAMEIAIEKAKKVGTGWVSVKNSNHYGIAGAYVMMTLPHDMIGISMTNASPLVAPTFSKDRLLGTNPIAVSIPTGTQSPIIVDMATTSVANGKLEVAQRENKNIPLGWAQTKNGEGTTNPYVLKEGGSMLPLGSDYAHGSHKGYCLGAVVDIFSAVLSGANYGPWVPPFVSFIDPKEDAVGEGIGHFFGAMRIDAFRTSNEFKKHIDNWITTFREANTLNEKNKVLIPGDIEREISEQRLQRGVQLNEFVIADLKTVANKFHLKF